MRRTQRLSRNHSSSDHPTLFPVSLQMTFFDLLRKDQVVNVASVPQRSPFRYPGGKTWLVPRIRSWLRGLPHKPSQFIEPFAGGGIISLTVAFESLASKVVMIELDEDVAAVWQTILGGDAAWLADRLNSFEMTLDNVQETLAKKCRTVRERGFQTLLKNRVYHGGILAPGSGLIRYGENGKGLSSRWYPQTLAKRVMAIYSIRDRIEFHQGDGVKIIREKSRLRTAAFFIDPPYTAAGKRAGSRLYKYHALDHGELFRVCARLAGPFLITYDNADEISALARGHGFNVATIAMKNTHHANMTELVISRDLGWLK